MIDKLKDKLEMLRYDRQQHYIQQLENELKVKQLDNDIMMIKIQISDISPRYKSEAQDLRNEYIELEVDRNIQHIQHLLNKELYESYT